MPALHYWFNETALFLAASFFFALIMGVIGIRKDFSRKAYIASWAVALILTALAWHTAAKQGEDEDRKAAELRDIRTDYHRLLDPITRRIHPEQMNAFWAAAQKVTGKKTFVSIVTNPECVDCEAYAEDLRSTLENGGWLATTSGFMLGVKYHSPRGVMIGIRLGNKVPTNVADLVKCLDAAKIGYDLVPAGASESASDAQIVLLVMPRRADAK